MQVKKKKIQMFPSWCYNHLMVYLRLGWLTVLSSRKMVEQELYLRLKVPCYKYTNTQTKDCYQNSHVLVSSIACKGNVHKKNKEEEKNSRKICALTLLMKRLFLFSRTVKINRRHSTSIIFPKMPEGKKKPNTKPTKCKTL